MIIPYYQMSAFKFLVSTLRFFKLVLFLNESVWQFCACNTTKHFVKQLKVDLSSTSFSAVRSNAELCRTQCLLPGCGLSHGSKMLLQWIPASPRVLSLSQNRLQKRIVKLLPNCSNAVQTWLHAKNCAARGWIMRHLLSNTNFSFIFVKNLMV